MESLLRDTIRKSRMPARLDAAQSITGVFLGLFMWAHMFLIASILLGKGSFSFVARLMEGAFFTSSGEGYPVLVFFAVSGVFAIFITHALLGMRKFPINFQQYRIIRSQMKMMKHRDTNLWFVQALTGFIMFFLGSFHLYTMWSNPGQIDTYLSADRFYSHSMWPLYATLLICVELHATIGLYRAAVKWGFFMGDDPVATRKKLQDLKNRVTVGFLAVGFLALFAFLTIGYFHSDNVGERYYTHSARTHAEISPEVVPEESGGESHIAAVAADQKQDKATPETITH